jgi:hypothetical protein
MSLTLTTPPAYEPITLAEAKAQLVVEHTADDTLIQTYIAAARDYVEKFLGRDLAERTWTWKFDRFPWCDIELPRDSILTLTADLPPGDAGVRLGLAPGYGSFVPRQTGGGADAYEGFLTGGSLTPELPRAGILTESAGAVFLRYIGVGFEHILPLGLDHILFVLGLYFFASRAGPLLWQVTAFTLAHSITLGLTIMEWLTPPAEWVEPAIALSVVLAALNNLLGLSSLKRWRLAFVFGLVHGFGFANVLLDLGLPASALLAALGGFNVGVELGQLAIVLVFLPVAWLLRRTLFYRWVVVAGGSLAIVVLGTFWTLQRTGWLA